MKYLVFGYDDINWDPCSMSLSAAIPWKTDESFTSNLLE
jgi:hypothetical protein